MKSIWTGWVLGAALTLAGCGGGGGSPVQETPALSAAVRVSNLKPQRVDIQAVETERSIFGVELSADVVGDLTRLSGQTIYMIIEDGTGLFEVASTTISPTGVDNRILLKLKSTLGKAGTLEGNLRLNVCIDVACKTSLGNSPLSIPYKLTIAPGVRLADSSPITVEVPFGAVLADAYGANAVNRPVTLNVPSDFAGVGSIPPFETDWSSAQANARLALLQYGAIVPGQAVAGALLFPPAPVGNYSAKLKLSSIVGNSSIAAESAVDVNYVVKDSGQRMLYQPSTMSVQSSSNGDIGLSVVAADGAKYTRVGHIAYSASSGSVRWLFLQPASAGAFSMGTVFLVSPDACGVDLPRVSCLTRGAYTADVFLATDAGVEAPVPYRVQLMVP
ncbi:hypothetical protein LXT12_02060 [Pelomonas sp. P7]|uniref:Lipoprotein n=1 Tax=Pelomonas caseinilytica TaxID=2906763 RepID=A0ABS8X6I9_9BURK|nr:hypothetical protein [Pelomonas sp. P7]MCE4536044.1 hypothetical protein [Pelomonas sp. P7]